MKPAAVTFSIPKYHGASFQSGAAMWKSEIRKSSRSATLPKPNLSIGENLSALRKDRGLTLKAAAAVCSVSAATLSRIENGTHSPTFNVIASKYLIRNLPTLSEEPATALWICDSLETEI